MSTLSETQLSLQSALLKAEEGILNLISANDLAEAKLRLNVYSEGYRLRLIEALAEDFSVLASYLGEESFERLANAYCDHYPSRHFSLRHFGQFFSTFLTEDFKMKKNPVLSELAEFEWALVEVMDAKNAEPLTVDDLQNIPPENWPDLKFSLHPSVEFHDFHYNILTFWQEIDEDSNNRPEMISLDELQSCMIWRHDNRAFFQSLSQQENHFLTQIKANKNFSDISEAMLAVCTEEKVAQRVGEILMRLTQDSILIKPS